MQVKLSEIETRARTEVETADRLAGLARAYERWGLTPEADDAWRLARDCRVRALHSQGEVAVINLMFGSPGAAVEDV